MKLRLKTLLIVGTTLVLLLAAIGLLARAVLLGGFARVENTDTERNLNRFEDAVTAAVDNLTVKAADWANWDDTYRFVVDHNKAYVESNLTDAGLSALEMQFMVFLDRAGAVVADRQMDPKTGTGGQIPPDLLAQVLKRPKLTTHQSLESIVQGILALPTGPVMITSRPILTSDGNGPINGTLIFAQALDDARIAKFGEVTHLAVKAVPAGAPGVEVDMASAIRRLAAGGHLVEPLDSKRIAGYTVLKDIDDRPVLLARIILPRDIYGQGIITMLYLLLSVLVAGVAFGVAIMILLGRTVISRVARLNSDVGGIESSLDHSGRVQVTGRDELAGLGRSINGMLEALQRAESEVRTRSKEMRLIMDAVPTGLLSVDGSGRVNPEYSRSAARILGHAELAGKDIFELLRIDGERQGLRGQMEGLFDILRRRLLPPQDAAGLNPCAEHLLGRTPGGAEQWLRTGFSLMEREGGQAGHLLVVVEDISEEKASKARAAESERENMQLKVIAEDPDLFREFLAETARQVRHARDQLPALAESGDPAEALNEIFRDAHTVKGSASSFGLSALTEAAGTTEEILSRLRKSRVAGPRDAEEVRASLGALESALATVVDRTRGLLGDDPTEGVQQIRISTDRLQAATAEIDALVAQRLTPGEAATRFRETIRRRLLSLRAVPARRGLARSLRLVPGLAARLGKEITFTLVGEETPIDYAVARELNTPLVHLVRNAFDHGIESAEERLARGKPAAGDVRVTVERAPTGLQVSVRDDGRGLDPRRLASVAVASGLITREEADRLSPAETLGLVFRPGFTTSESVNEVSGRGVGLDAVRSSVERVLRGKVGITTEVGKGTTFTLKIPDQE